MSKIDSYRAVLRTLDNWDSYLLEQLRLPGPRANLELAQALADEGDLERFLYFLTFEPQSAPTNTPGEFLAFCGVLGLGKLIAQGRLDLLPKLRGYASDPRWRVREAVAMALQRLGGRICRACSRRWNPGERETRSSNARLPPAWPNRLY